MASSSDKATIPVGMDVGTCHSVLSFIPNGTNLPKTIVANTGLHTHVSAVYYSPDSSKPNVYGQAAIDKLPDNNVITCPKRGLCVTSSKIINGNIQLSFNAKMTTKGQAHPKFAIERNGKTVEKTPAEAMADLLTEYKRLIDAEVGDDKIGLVVSMPECWVSGQVNLLSAALKKAGFSPLQLISEPAAAHIAYKCSPKPEIMEVFFVTDLGDGTFDCSLMQETGPGIYKTMMCGGDEHLGSRDVDHLLFQAMQKEMREDGTFNEDNFKQQEPQLLHRMKQMKHKLSELDEVTEQIFGVTKTVFKFTVDKTKKMEILEPFYKQIRTSMKNIFVKKAEVSEGIYTFEQLINAVHGVIVVGGGMRDSIISNEILPEMFPNAKILGRYGVAGSINPDVVVSFGCAQWAANLLEIPLKYGLPPGSIIMRTLPKNLGVQTVIYVDGKEVRIFSVIIPSQSGIPIAKSDDHFSLSKVGQKDVEISIFQGEGDSTDDPGVVKLGSFNVPVNTANEDPKIEIEFQVDENCVLLVTASIDDGEPEDLEIRLENY